jgi:hypothetical protein
MKRHCGESVWTKTFLAVAGLGLLGPLTSARLARADDAAPQASSVTLRFTTSAADADLEAAACSLDAHVVVDGRSRKVDVVYEHRDGTASRCCEPSSPDALRITLRREGSDAVSLCVAPYPSASEDQLRAWVGSVREELSHRVASTPTPAPTTSSGGPVHVEGSDTPPQPATAWPARSDRRVANSDGWDKPPSRPALARVPGISWRDGDRASVAALVVMGGIALVALAVWAVSQTNFSLNLAPHDGAGW